jgi:hypothetical protein
LLWQHDDDRGSVKIDADVMALRNAFRLELEGAMSRMGRVAGRSSTILPSPPAQYPD